jgi:hypothetical protein
MILDDSVDSDILLFCAFRYALTKHTYVVGSIVGTLIENWPHMKECTREKFRTEIREHIHCNWDMDCDEWNRILKLE